MWNIRLVRREICFIEILHGFYVLNLDLCFIIVRLPAWASRYFNTEKFKYCLTYHLFDAFDRAPEMARLSSGFLQSTESRNKVFD